MENASHAPHLRDLNTRLVHQSLKSARTATVRDLAAATGLSTVTVGTIVQALVTSGSAVEGDLVPSNGGRPSRLYRFEARKSLVLVVLTREIGGQDTVCLRVADLYGQVIDAQEQPMTPARLADFEPALDALFARHPSIRALGFGLPGIESQGTIVALDYPGLVGSPILAHFQDRYGVPVVFENDVNAAVLGRGAREGAASSEAYLYFPKKYAPGAGLRVDGRLLKGRRHFAGEVGFLPLGISWGDPAFLSSFEAVCTAAARVVASLAAVLDPESVVLFGEHLTPAHRDAVEAHCRTLLPGALVPNLSLTLDFTRDFEEGLVGLTLNALDR